MVEPATPASSSTSRQPARLGAQPRLLVFLAVALPPLLVVFWGVYLRSRSRPAVSRPNVLVLLADDLSWAAPGFQGNPYTETPNLDRLAAEGTVLSSFYGCPTCRPARVALLTGCYPARYHIFSTGPSAPSVGLAMRLLVPSSFPKLPRRTRTVASLFQKVGYVTGLLGKWQLEPARRLIPPQRGFTAQNEVLGFKRSGGCLAAWGRTTKQITDAAIEFIRRHRSRPFFLYVAYHAVHRPLVPPPALLRHFANKPRQGRGELPAYAAKIAEMDGEIGRLLAELRRLRLERNTIVVFTSDNGGAGGYEGPAPRIPWPADNRPLRSGKGTVYEGGIRVPFVVRWPGRIPAGRRLDEPAHLIDVAPTLLSLAGIRSDVAFDGWDLAALLVGREQRRDARPLFWYAPCYTPHPKRAEVPRWRATPCEAVRFGSWKLVHFFEDDRIELYNLDEDIGESEDLASAYPEVAEELLGRLRAWRDELGLPVPRPRSGSARVAGGMRTGPAQW